MRVFIILLLCGVFFPNHILANDKKAHIFVKEAELFVEDTAKQVINILKDNPPLNEREQLFQSILVPRLDIKRLARFTLGKKVREISKDDLHLFEATLQNFVVQIYAKRLASYEYNNERFTLLGSQQKKQHIFVSSHIEFPQTQNEPIPIKWWLLEKDGNYKIFDLQILGVWMAQEQRESFRAFLQTHQGDIHKLISHLENKINPSN